MGKYVYICFVRWTEKAHEKGREYFDNTWFPKHNKICDEHGVTLLKWGEPFGNAENHVFIYETDLPLDEYVNFRSAISQIAEERYIDYTRTISVNCPA